MHDTNGTRGIRHRRPMEMAATGWIVQRSLLLVALIGIILGGCAAVGNASDIAFSGIAIDGARPAPVAMSARLTIPDGPGPFPIVIILHGCGGIGPMIGDWTARVKSWGYAAAVFDSLQPRGHKTVCPPPLQPLVTPRDRAGDVYGLALALRHVPRIDATRIAVLGFSHGGGTAAEVTRRAFQNAYPGLIKAAVNYYGNCREPGQHGTIPLLAMAGDADTWGPPAVTCAQFGARMRPEQHFQQVIYPGAVHAFDNMRLATRVANQGHPLQYDPGAAADSFARTRALLAEWLGP